MYLDWRPHQSSFSTDSGSGWAAFEDRLFNTRMVWRMISSKTAITAITADQNRAGAANTKPNAASANTANPSPMTLIRIDTRMVDFCS